MSYGVHVDHEGSKIRIELEIEIPDAESMLGCEQLILQRLNEAGRVATAECLGQFDTDGSPIQVGGVKLTSKGKVAKDYQTPYGEISLARHVYQTSKGGMTYCPLDESARVIKSTTPRFAQMCARKYATMKSTQAKQDLLECHDREVSRCYLQDIAAGVAEVAERKEERWSYAVPTLPEDPSHAVVSLDGTCLLYCEEGWRSVMVGTLSLYDVQGERLHTAYLASPPEYGKASFLRKMEREIGIYKERYPELQWIGIADGAKDYWPWLEQFAETSVLDFYHAASYLELVAEALHRSPDRRASWFQESRRTLKEEPGGAEDLLAEIQQALRKPKLGQRPRENLEKAATYFENNLSRMDYQYYRSHCFPIGSGVTEAACKIVVKERMCGSGMKWKHRGTSTVLTLRSLLLSEGRWEQFWSKIVRFGT